MIGILDYKLGNLRSVQKALEHVGAQAEIVTRPDGLEHYAGLVLPGVGSFGDGMKYLREIGFIEPLQAYAAAGKPLLGVCLGFQLLFEGSQEGGTPDKPIAGLGLLPGQVVRFTVDQTDDVNARLKVPHMGWNTLIQVRESPLLQEIESQASVYFVHGYHVQTADDSIVVATTDYGSSFCSVAQRDNIFATQFHPEKSQRVGLTMLRNFAQITGSLAPASAGNAG